MSLGYVGFKTLKISFQKLITFKAYVSNAPSKNAVSMCLLKWSSIIFIFKHCPIPVHYP